MSGTADKAPVAQNRQSSAQNSKRTREDLWTQWVMQTAKVWEDITGIIKKTDIETIDSDHKILTEITLAINNILGQGGHFSLEWVTEQSRVLDHLYIFADHHFQREEKIIADYDLPNADQQRVQHEKFLAMVRDNIEGFQQGRLAVGINLKNRILEWWVNHINHLDYDTFCRENWTKALLKKAVTWGELMEIAKPTQIDQIDHAHRTMTELALQLQDSVDASGGRERLLVLFQRMRECAQDHFQHEEALIRRHALPGLSVQLAQHPQFLHALEQYPLELQRGTLRLHEVRYQLLDWWIGHVNVVDNSSFALDNLADRILLLAQTWEELAPFIRRIGLAAIDDEHRTITGYILELNHTFTTQADAPGLRDALQSQFAQLLSSSRAHFGRETKIMTEIQSPLAKLHLAEHHHFLSMVQSYQSNFLFGRIHLTRNLQRMMLIWWVNHISQYDYPTFGSLAREPA
ncbi:MAG: hemerythrin family protein [Magnetococcus sp. MYC-9]